MGLRKRERPKELERLEPCGVPIGCIGTGCIEFGPDSRPRNVTINNNRTTKTRIPLVEGTFLAIRAAEKGRVAARILQPATSLPFEKAGILPPYTSTEMMSWSNLYPTADYTLADPAFPIETRWRIMAPLIPYDVEASALPLIQILVSLKNTKDTTLDTSVVFNWENISGCAHGHFPENRGPIQPVSALPQFPLKTAFPKNQPLSALGLVFGHEPPYESNHEGNYCLVSPITHNINVSIMSWNHRDPAQLDVFWRQFHDEGHLGNLIARHESSHSGAVCARFSLEPEQTQLARFVFAWFCPRFTIQDINMSNGYTNLFTSSLEVASKGLQHGHYYANAVDNWRQRIIGSSLPRWFSRMLINNNSVFSTNTLFTADGKFAMMESPAQPLTGRMDRRLHSSLGTLLFFPDFEDREMLLFSKTVNPDQPGRIYRDLGHECLHAPSYGDHPDEQADLIPAFVLLAYRNYLMTGKRVSLQNMYPRIKEAMEYALKHDRDGDGLPELSGYATTFDNLAVFGANSYASSLWVAALRAFIQIARRVGNQEDATRFKEIFDKAATSFEQRLWDNHRGYYRLYDNKESATNGMPPRNDGCHTGQLAGQWYADFLGLGQLFSFTHMEKAMDHMRELNEKALGVMNAVMPDGSPLQNPPEYKESPRSTLSWPNLILTYFSSLQFYYRRSDRALYSIQKIYKNIHVIRGRPYDQPLQFDMDERASAGPAQDRHMSPPAIWHALYALEGFLLNQADKVMWIRPNLPLNVFTLDAPLVTPICFGRLRYQEEPGRPYLQRVETSFDSPIPVQTIILRVPPHVQNVHVHVTSDAGPEPCEHTLGYDGPHRLVQVRAKNPILIQNPMLITLTQTM